MLLVGAGLIVSLGILLNQPTFPLGVDGEWEWLRLPQTAELSPIRLLIASAVLLIYGIFVCAGSAQLSDQGTSRLREVRWVVCLFLIAPVVQVGLMYGAPFGYGIAKWVALSMPGASGYQTVARMEIDDLRAFLKDYPDWIQQQDALHIGTHPPGLFVLNQVALRITDQAQGATRFIDQHLPAELETAFREFGVPRSDRIAQVFVGLATLLASAWTAIPIYLILRRLKWSPAIAWSSAALWPVLPASIMFQPTADTAFPILSALAICLVIKPDTWSVFAAGIILGVGMWFSLVFLAVGLVVGLATLWDQERSIWNRARNFLLIGFGFLGLTIANWILTDANPFEIWWANQSNHARFYEEFPRSYFKWMLTNPIELIVAIGLPTALWIMVLLVSRRSLRITWVTLGVLLLLTLTGRSLSEIARLWLPFYPLLVIAIGPGISRLNGGWLTTGLTIILVGVQVLILQSIIQVVYPV